MFFVQTIDCFVSSSIFFPGQVNIIWQQKSEDRLMVVVRFWLHLPPFPIHMCSLLKYHQQSPHLQTSFNKCLLPLLFRDHFCSHSITLKNWLPGVLVPPKAIKLNNAPLLYIAELRVHNIEMPRLYVFTYIPIYHNTNDPCYIYSHYPRSTQWGPS